MHDSIVVPIRLSVREAVVDQPARRRRESLEYTNVNKTMFFAQVIKRGGRAVRSPFDAI